MRKFYFIITFLLFIITLSSCINDKPKNKPIINGTNDFEFVVGSPRPNWLEGVNAYDYNDEEILVRVDASDVDLQTPGVYKLTYFAVDNSNQETKITVNITILEKDTTPPIITGTRNYTLYVNSTKPNWLEGIVITDNVDVNPILTVDDSDVKMDIIGTYNLTYKGIDNSSNETIITVLVEIITKPIETTNPTFPNRPIFGTNVSVHDPSIIYADGKYYAFGSHFAVSSSIDLITWNQEIYDGGHNALYGDWRNVLSDALSYVGQSASSTWAPGMIKIDDTYYMYYSLSTFGSQRSYIGRVESKNILGPYTNSVEIIKTELGEGPNAIDAEIFFDEDGKLWMVYGSFFGGIYIKELHNSGPDIGLPKENDFGKKIWNGSGTGPEGPYIFYNYETEYYYLMVSHGSLSSNYNMRVTRSKNPDGPYLDINNIDVSLNSNGGNKLAGNYQFADATGYAALGHNSVIKVENKYIVIYHTRYKQGQSGVSGQHNMMATQLLFNQDGWPLLSPSRYAGDFLQEIKNGDLVGDYDIIIHSGGNDQSFIKSNTYTFNSDGTITNGGSWQIIAPYYIQFNLNNKWYSGTVIPSWNHYLDKPALSITAVNLRDGISLWAYKK